MSVKAFAATPALALVGALVASCGSGGSDDTYSLDTNALQDPQSCTTCHADHVREWSGSMHAYASDDPVFRAMNARGQRETNGQLGDFCVKCHAPVAVRTGATKDGTNLDQVPAKLKGVTCYFCHSIASVEGSHNSSVTLATDDVLRGPISDPVKNTAHRAAYSPLHDRDRLESASLCGACHDITTPPGAAIERTFAEWQGTVFSHAPGGETCSQCHMDQSANLRPIANAPGVFARRFHSHAFPAVDTALTDFPEAADQKARVASFMKTTLQSALCVAQVGTSTTLRVILDNVAAGHGWPSGSAQDRRAFVEVVAYQSDQPVYQSGVVADGQSVVDVGASDPDLWLLRDCMFDGGGAEVHMFWQAASYETNQLPGQLTFDQTDPRYYQTHVYRSFPKDASRFLDKAPDKVTLRVRMQPIGADVLDDLVKSGDLDPAVKAKIAPIDVTDTLTWTPAAATQQNAGFQDGALRFQCVTATNLNVAADKVPAPERTRCSP